MNEFSEETTSPLEPVAPKRPTQLQGIREWVTLHAMSSYTQQKTIFVQNLLQSFREHFRSKIYLKENSLYLLTYVAINEGFATILPL